MYSDALKKSKVHLLVVLVDVVVGEVYCCSRASQRRQKGFSGASFFVLGSACVEEISAVGRDTFPFSAPVCCACVDVFLLMSRARERASSVHAPLSFPSFPQLLPSMRRETRWRTTAIVTAPPYCCFASVVAASRARRRETEVARPCVGVQDRVPGLFFGLTGAHDFFTHGRRRTCWCPCRCRSAPSCCSRAAASPRPRESR